MNKLSYLDQGQTCVILKDGKTVFSSTKNGIMPLLDAINSGIDTKGCTAVDKIVGKAAALLYIYMGVSEVCSEIMGEEGYSILIDHGIKVYRHFQTGCIVNRRGDGICPMEEAVAGITDPGEALTAVTEKLRQLRSKN